MDAVAAGLGADIDHGVTDAAGPGVEHPVGAGDSDAHGVDQDVAVVGAVEGAFAADGGHADAVAVATDTGDDAAQQVAGLGVRWVAEAQGIEQRHRTGAHGEHVAQDAADAGGRPLVGLDEGGVVVALHLEDGHQAIADVDHAGVLARAADDPRSLGRKLAEVDLRGFVGAMLAPHHREDAELDQVRRTAKDRQNELVLVGLEAVFDDDGGRDRVAHAKASSRERNSGRPSLPPSSGAIARSGWGIRPSTLRLGLRTPGDVGGRAVGVVAIAEGDTILAFEALQAIRIDNVVAVMVSHRQPDRGVAIARGERAGRGHGLEFDEAANEAQVGIADQRTRQQTGFGQDLKAVADAEHGGSGLRAPHHLAHHGAAGGHRTAAQIIAVGEAAGHADQVEPGQLGLLVPDAQHGLPEDGFHGDGEVAVAVGAGKGDDRGADQDVASGKNASSSACSRVNGHFAGRAERAKPVSLAACNRADR